MIIDFWKKPKLTSLIVSVARTDKSAHSRLLSVLPIGTGQQFLHRAAEWSLSLDVIQLADILGYLLLVCRWTDEASVAFNAHIVPMIIQLVLKHVDGR